MERRVFETCHNCGVRFSKTETWKRKRYLQGQDEVLLTLNYKRRLENKPPLDYNNIICHDCYRGAEYAASSRSTSSAEDEEMETSDPEDTTNGKYIVIEAFLIFQFGSKEMY